MLNFLFNFFLKKLSTNNFLNNSAWAISGSFVSKGLMFLGGLAVVNLLGKFDFGVFSLMKSTIVAFSTFFALGFNYVCTKFIAESLDGNEKNIYQVYKLTGLFSLSLSIVSIVVIVFFGNTLSTIIIQNNENIVSFSLISPFVLAYIMYNWTVGVMSGLGKFKKLAFNDIINGISTFIFTVTLTFFYGINGALISLFFSYFLCFLLNMRSLNNEIKYYKTISNPDLNLIQKILKFSLPFSLQEMVYPIFVWGTNFSIVYYSSYEALGLFSAALQWNAIVIIIPAMLKNVILSNISSNISKIFETKQVITNSVKINFITSGLVAVVIIILSKIKFFKTLYIDSFEGIDQLILIGVLSSLILSISDVYLQFLIANSKNWLVLLLKFFRDAIKIILIILLIDYSLTEIVAVNRVLIIILLTNTLFFFSIVFSYKNFLRKIKNVS